MSIGMPAEQFWEGDPWLVAGYREANRLSIQRKSEEMWLQGLYIHHAVSVAVGNMFREKGKAPQKYLEEPIRMIPLTEEERQERAEKERQKTIEYFSKLEKQFRSVP